MLVWINRVYSKNFVTDFLQTLKNWLSKSVKFGIISESSELSAMV